MKTMKKLLVILMALALILWLAACGGSSGSPQPEKYTAEELYDMYLNDQITAVTECVLYGAAQGSELLISDMIYGEADALKEYDEYFLGDVYYSLIDCGLDGEKELLVCAEYLTPGENGSYLEEQFIVKAYDQELKVLTEDESFYRYVTTVYDSGLIISSGSSSEFDSYFMYEYMNAEGERVFLFSEDYYSGLAEAVIPYYEIPSDAIEGYDAWPEYAEADGLGLSVFSLERYEYDDYDDEKYDDYLRGHLFVFYGIDGDNCYPEEPYASMYKEAGINVCDSETADEMINKHMEESGLTQEIAEGAPAELTLLDSETVEWLPKG